MQDARPKPNSVIHKGPDGASESLFYTSGLLVHGSNQTGWYSINLSSGLKLHFSDWHSDQLEAGILANVHNLEDVRRSGRTVIFRIKRHRPRKTGEAPRALDELIRRIIRAIYHAIPVDKIDWASHDGFKKFDAEDHQADAQEGLSVLAYAGTQHRKSAAPTKRYHCYGRDVVVVTA